MTRRLLTGWLLAMLDAPRHGYDMHGELRALGFTGDPGTVYRALRALERDDLARSQWRAPQAGPRQRVYELTDAGRAARAQIEAELARDRDDLDRFLNR